MEACEILWREMTGDRVNFLSGRKTKIFLYIATVAGGVHEVFGVLDPRAGPGLIPRIDDCVLIDFAELN